VSRPASWPVFWQLGSLALAAVLAAQIMSFGIIALFPPPPEPGLTVNAVIEAIKAGADTDGFHIELRPDPPFAPEELDNPTMKVVAASIAEGLQIVPADVQVAMLDKGALTSGGPIHGSEGRKGGVAIFNASVAPPVGVDGAPPPLSLVLRSAAVPFAPFATAVRQPGGAWLVVEPAGPSWLSPIQQRMLLAFALSALILSPLTWYVARLLTRPIRKFAEAAEKFGLDREIRPLEAEGGPELKAAAGAVNRMHERLKRHVEDRTTAVAAIAHDLRTPLTSLRLRAETLPFDIRARMTSDIDRLIQMVEQVLAFVRGERGREPRSRIDLGKLALDCAREIEETGAEVECRAESDVWVDAEPMHLRRALTNLIDNAVKYGERARINVALRGSWAIFEVEDDGPGLPAGFSDRVLEPFIRLEPSRNRATGGAGLGLAVANTMARVHGGSIEMMNLPDGGLLATMTLPAAGAEVVPLLGTG
jgi:signal transduction histidine kinase